MKIVKIVATRCHTLRLKCTKFNFGWGSAPNPRWVSLQRSPDPQLDFRGLLPSGKREREEGGGGINLPNCCLKNLAALQMQQ